MIQLEAVSKVHGTRDAPIIALDGVGLRVSRGEFVALVGASGSGKSTMMNIIGLLDRPTSGDLEIAGQNASRLGARELAEVRNQTIGFVFQSFHLLPRLTAWQNVALPLRYRGISVDVRRERAMQMLARFGLEARADHLPDQLSGGQRQRVALSRALVGNPPIILADEPTGNLDSKAALDVLDRLAELNQGADPATIVMVTHDHGLASRCSRVVELLDGRIIADSAPA